MVQIGPSPLEAFQIGTQLRGPSAMGQMAMGLTQHLMSQMTLRQEARIKGEEEFKLQERLIPLKTEAARSLIQEKAKTASKFPKPLSAEGASKFALARAGERATQGARNVLFPGGTAESFRADISQAAKNPLARAWGGWVQGLPKVSKKDAQLAYDRIKQAYKSQIRIESGAAIPEPEVEREAQDRTSNLFADPEAAFEKLDTLETLLRGIRTTMDPTGAYSGLITPADYQPEESESGLMLDPETGWPQGGELLEYLD